MPSKDFIPITKPVIDEREADAARRPILSGWVTQGPEVAAFKGEFAAFIGAPHALPCPTAPRHCIWRFSRSGLSQEMK